MIKIDRQTHKIEIIGRTASIDHIGGMPIFDCSCGKRILVVPDLREMSKVIKNHLSVHKKLTGECLTEDMLTQQILTAVCEYWF